MMHAEGKPCLSCSIGALATMYNERFGYTVEDLLLHVTSALAEMIATTANVGQEKEAAQVIREAFDEMLKDAFVDVAQRRAEAAAGPKEPTTSDIGHA